MSHDTEQKSTPIAAEPRKRFLPLKFVHKKDSSFRTFHADGAWGVQGTGGNILLNFFVEHEPMADVAIYPVDEAGSVSGEGQLLWEKDDKHFVIIRDLQACIVLSIDAATNLHTMLGNFIKLTEQRTKSAKTH
jgi:hypothetical protein